MQHTVRQARKPAQSGLSGTLGRAAETLSFTKDAITYSAARGTTSAYAVSGGYAAARDTAVSAYDRAGSAGAGFYDSAVMFERLIKLEKDDDGGDETQLATNFNVLHRYSSLFNLLSLAGQIWQLWYLCRRLVI